MTRHQTIKATMQQVKAALAQGVDIKALGAAKEHLLELASQTELFSREDFIPPGGESIERTICLYEEQGGQFALYANVARPGQRYIPHDHGDSWAIVVAVRGREKHIMYQCADDDSQPGFGRLEKPVELIVEPGHGVSLLCGGIHSIETVGNEDLLHLHCYGLGFPHQTSRKEYDLQNGTYVLNNDIGLIEDMREQGGV